MNNLYRPLTRCHNFTHFLHQRKTRRRAGRGGRRRAFVVFFLAYYYSQLSICSSSSSSSLRILYFCIQIRSSLFSRPFVILNFFLISAFLFFPLYSSDQLHVCCSLPPPPSILPEWININALHTLTQSLSLLLSVHSHWSCAQWNGNTEEDERPTSDPAATHQLFFFQLGSIRHFCEIHESLPLHQSVAVVLFNQRNHQFKIVEKRRMNIDGAML